MVKVRRAVDDDLPAILALLETTMGWDSAEPNLAFFRWKHLANPFGRSPMWLAHDGDRLAGFRTFMRWEFTRGDDVVRAVRAVDTATHPDFQGQGIFTTLTMAALADLRGEGVSFVFNTPNDKSRPGYLKMGWAEVGRLPARVRPVSVLAPVRMARSRVPAAKWSEPSVAGVDAVQVLSDVNLVRQLVASQPPSARLRTRRTPEFLRWRYGFEPLRYRVLANDADSGAGLAVFRVRRRGTSTEAALVDVLALGADRAGMARLASRAARSSKADYAVVLGVAPSRAWLPLPGGGPILTCRPLDGSEPPSMDEWDLALGDIELF